ncbi:type I polyketide synthase [Microbispora sp. NPDC049125]|uniref:type I polyketide synthase n=1 Tax=Microbispora sp. NPDC049125 TaxID=3154929 RepID=UPI003465A07C
MTPVAIVGIDCRFAGAGDPEQFWELLRRGEEGIGPVPPQRWDVERYVSEDGRPGTANSRLGGFIEDAEAFDHEFFGISPKEAAALDPQQRLVLQTVWRAIEDATIDPRSLAGSRTGVFVGLMSSEWGNLHMLDFEGLTPQRGSGNGYCMVANRVSYHLDLKGPSIAVDTACSSSLMATHLGVSALVSGECDLVVVAGVNLMLTPALSIFYTQAGLSAPDGRCKPFAAAADGIGRGEGVGVVVLRRLEDAMADRQPVYAVIEGSAANQDGRSNGITAPNRWSQREVMARALERAGVAARDLTFVEAHGTGTILGDMIEVNALGELHGQGRDEPCWLGSVKGNLGHTEGAAGIAALIKTSLAMSKRTVPPTRHSREENPRLKLRENGLRLAKAPVQLPRGRVLAGVSSFGLGGTNVHVVLGSAPPTRWPARDGEAGVLTVSAASPEALRRNAAALLGTLGATADAQLSQVCFSSNRVKASLRHRLAVAGRDRATITGLLSRALSDDAAFEAATGRAGARPRTGMLFTGQGSQYPAMTRRLYEASPPYRERLDAVDQALRPHLGYSLVDALFAGGEEIHDTGLAQPALFAVEYAMGGALLDLGVRPAFMLGHSVGEYAAACLAGALDLEDAARLIVLRGALMRELPRSGSMIAVKAAVEDVRPLVDACADVSLAAVNGPGDVVVSGDSAAVAAIGDRLAAGGARVTRLTVSHAFHSPLMRPVLEAFGEAAATVTARTPSVPVISTLRGRRLDGEPMDGAYWTEHIEGTVRFGDALAVALAGEPTHLVEVGPRPVLLPLARRAGAAPASVRGLVPCPGPAATGAELAETIAALYLDGVEPRWPVLYSDGQRVPRRLPVYEFATAGRFWVDGAVATVVRHTRPGEPAAGAAAPVTAAAVEVGHDPVIAAIAAVGGYAPAEIRLEARLQEDLGYDSVILMQLMDQLKAGFPALGRIPVAEVVPQVATVADLLALVRDPAEVA